MADTQPRPKNALGSMWQRASAGAKAANVSYDDSLVALTALRSVGMQEEVAARFFGQLAHGFEQQLIRARTRPRRSRISALQLRLSRMA